MVAFSSVHCAVVRFTPGGMNPNPFRMTPRGMVMLPWFRSIGGAAVVFRGWCQGSCVEVVLALDCAVVSTAPSVPTRRTARSPPIMMLRLFMVYHLRYHVSPVVVLWIFHLSLPVHSQILPNYSCYPVAFLFECILF